MASGSPATPFRKLFPSQQPGLPNSQLVTAIHGLGVSLAEQAVMETGTDMSKFPTEKHVCSWLGLAPKHEITGGKIVRNATLKTRNRAGLVFRKAAASVMRSDGVFGVFYRRLKARIGPAQAAVATAHFIARVYYRMFKVQSGISALERGAIRSQISSAAGAFPAEESCPSRLPTHPRLKELFPRSAGWAHIIGSYGTMITLPKVFEQQPL